jgi:hypothetical protein
MGRIEVGVDMACFPSPLSSPTREEGDNGVIFWVIIARLMFWTNDLGKQIHWGGLKDEDKIKIRKTLSRNA